MKTKDDAAKDCADAFDESEEGDETHEDALFVQKLPVRVVCRAHLLCNLI